MTPAPYLSRASLAEALDMAESTVDEMVKRGILPAPIKLSTGCVRYCWAEVETAGLEAGDLRWIAQGLAAYGRDEECAWLRTRIGQPPGN